MKNHKSFGNGNTNLKHYEFTVVLSGYGHTKGEAWEDALATLSENPQDLKLVLDDVKETKVEEVE